MKVILWLQNLVKIKFAVMPCMGVLVKSVLGVLIGQVQILVWPKYPLLVQIDAPAEEIAIVIFGFPIAAVAYNRIVPLP